MTYAVYYALIDENDKLRAEIEEFADTELKQSIDRSQELREAGYLFVTMISENNPERVGGNGVRAVVDGKLPDGSDYTWRKRRP